MVQARKELPGDVMIAFRKLKGHPRSIAVFAQLAGSNYTKIHRLESIRWGVNESEWLAHFDMRDLEPFIEVGWIAVNDKWYQRFLESLKWQIRVVQFGSAVYREDLPDSSEYAPITQEHFSVVIRAVLGKLKGELAPSGTADETKFKQAEEKLYEGVRSTLEAVGLLLSESDSSGEEVTRGMLQGLSADDDSHDSPYLHTLRFVVRYAMVIGRERIPEFGEHNE
ncbi:MAG: hypothetical protein ACYCZF_03560 [Anaerolineae bacterium]